MVQRFGVAPRVRNLIEEAKRTVVAADLSAIGSRLARAKRRRMVEAKAEETSPTGRPAQSPFLLPSDVGGYEAAIRPHSALTFVPSHRH